MRLGQKLIGIKQIIIFSCFVLAASSFAAKKKKPTKEPEERKVLKTTLSKARRPPTPSERNDRAVALEKMGYFHLALAERIEAAQNGQDSPQELERIGELALMADRLDPLLPLIQTLKSRGRDFSGAPALKAALAALWVRLGKLDRAEPLLPMPAEIGSLPARTRAAVLAGGVFQGLGKNEQAVKFLDQGSGAGFDQGLLHLQRARALYDTGNMDQVLEELILLPRSSSSWYQGVMVGAWAAYRVRDYNLALGQLMSVQSPFLIRKFNPESYVLEASALYRFCYFEAALQSLSKLKKHYETMVSSIDRYLKTYANRAQGLSFVLNYARGDKTIPGSLSEQDWDRVVDGILSTEAMSDVDRAFQMAAEEEKLFSTGGIADQRFARASVNMYRREVTEAKREATRKGLRILRARLNGMKKQVASALEDSLAVEVEVNTRLRERLITGKIPQMKAIDFETEINKGYEFWPFQKEFWRDEVGSYIFATTDVCAKGEGT